MKTTRVLLTGLALTTLLASGCTLEQGEEAPLGPDAEELAIPGAQDLNATADGNQASIDWRADELQQSAERYNAVAGDPPVDYVVAPTPTILPDDGTYNGFQWITFSSSNDHVTYYYTLDGSTPTTDSNEYAYPFVIEGPAQIKVKAIAVADGMITSSVATADYNMTYIAAADVAFIPAAGGYVAGQVITLLTETPDAEIYYRVRPVAQPGGQTSQYEPLVQYSGPFTLTEDVTISAFASAVGVLDSAPTEAVYTVN